jgi:hypothetical protein
VDPMQETLNRYYKSLKNQARGELNVLIKGKIAFDGDDQNKGYSDIIITVTDLATDKVIATCNPTSKEGKYYIILKPAGKYLIVAEKPGYQTYTKNLSLSGTTESYEMSLEIRFKK